MKIPTFQECREEEEMGRVYSREDENYILFCYAQRTQYDNLWNDVNIWCRGIIFEKETKSLVALPFKKFFNLNERPETQMGNLKDKTILRIAEKVDGSLGIVFYDKFEDKLRVSTKGALGSPQAIWATKWINNPKNYPENGMLYEDLKKHLSFNKTLLVEIIYPENRVVVDYGQFEGFIILCQMDLLGNLLYNFPAPKWPKATSHHFKSIEDAVNQAEVLTENEEGYVLTFEDGLMVKIKGKEYLRIHRLYSKLSYKNVWEMLSDGQNPDEHFSRLPDEFFEEAKQIKNEILAWKKEFEGEFDQKISSIKSSFGGNRKMLAKWAENNLEIEFRPPFFLTLSGQMEKLDDYFWKLVFKKKIKNKEADK